MTEMNIYGNLPERGNRSLLIGDVSAVMQLFDWWIKNRVSRIRILQSKEFPNAVKRTRTNRDSNFQTIVKGTQNSVSSIKVESKRSFVDTMLVSKNIIRESMKGNFAVGLRRFAGPTSRRALSSASVFSQNEYSRNYGYGRVAAAAVVAAGGAIAVSHHLETSRNVNCDFAQPSAMPWTPTGSYEGETAADGKTRIFTSAQVAENNGENGKPIWMSYGGNVYDVTDFVPNHPGGSEKIMLAAGGVSLIVSFQKAFLSVILTC